MSLEVTMMDSTATIFRPSSVTRDSASGTVQVFTVLRGAVPCSQQQAGTSLRELYKMRDADVGATLYFSEDPGTTVDDLAVVFDDATQQSNYYLIHGASFPVARGILWQVDCQNLQTPEMPASVVLPASTVAGNMATMTALVNHDGNVALSATGFVVSRTSVNNYPRIGGTGVTNIVVGSTVGAITSPFTGLSGVRYSFAPYATTSFGTSYGQVTEFVLE